MSFDIDTPIDQSTLSVYQKRVLAIGNIKSFADLLVTSSTDVARRCKISAQDAKNVYEKLLKECPMTEMTLLNDMDDSMDAIFSTGDNILDQALGGGIRTGMLWEIVGESSAGKTQFALQLSLAVQNPPTLGGLSGSTCYLTTSAQLPTSRLNQISENHPSMSSNVNLNKVHALSISSINVLHHVLANTLPSFIKTKKSSTSPIKLVVIDTLTELFHAADKTTKDTMFTRSKDLNQIASALHVLASTYNIAIVVLNEVMDRIDRGSIPHIPPPQKPSGSSRSKSKTSTLDSDFIYAQKARWFNSCDSIAGESAKEASLGLVWANQLNARILLTKTGRRRYIDTATLPGTSAKKARISEDAPTTQARHTAEDDEPQATLLRRLSVIFSSVSYPVSLDYIVTAAGVSALPDEEIIEELRVQTYSFANEKDGDSSSVPIAVSDPKPRTVVPSQHPSQSHPNPSQDEKDEWDKYWEEQDDISKHFEDFDAIELSLSQAS